MGAQLSRPASGRSRRRAPRYQPMSEINVTPFVDVMLVLLIVFMVSAPLLTVGVPIDLPQSRANPMEGDTEPLTVSVTADGQVFLQDSEIALDDLVPRLTAIAANGYDERIYVRGDQDAGYGAIMRVMGRLNAAGFRRIGLVTEQEPQT
ncbi:protein TolR [Amorphus orientalis]|uniref:Biopolymer transport protein TolR n=1 Tax=Amorphus orientalis TaxID=649198 RepID=A0AAE4AR96_9HYPH|nr:protein TolR [Amorphus orientalis]MDQ0313962.1 biopolymer transport protein TolR [Amorphus orientalis]